MIRRRNRYAAEVRSEAVSQVEGQSEGEARRCEHVHD